LIDFGGPLSGSAGGPCSEAPEGPEDPFNADRCSPKECSDFVTGGPRSGRVGGEFWSVEEGGLCCFWRRFFFCVGISTLQQIILHY
jgi:hypothetical protein